MTRAAPTQGARAPVIVAVLAAAASLATFWPGVALYDTVAQYGQVLSGEYDDWHPPAMARLWAVLHGAIGGGAAPMLVVQMLLYWLGFGLIAGALAATGRKRAAWATLLVAVWPPFLGWQAAVLKDAQMTGALAAAIGLVGWWRLRGRRVPPLAWPAVALLLGYAALVRANAVFAVVPLAVMLVPGWRAPARIGAALAGMLVVLGASGPINHDLLGAHRSGVERTEAIYDLAGIAVRAPAAPGGPIGRATVATLIERHCVKGFFWDPLGEPDRCNALVDPLRLLGPATLYGLLVRQILRHPLAYAGHRLSHFNSTERWLVPAAWPSAAPPMVGQPNEVGLIGPGPVASGFARVGGWLVETPLSWPFVWLSVACIAWLVALRRPAEPARDLALSLATAVLALEGSFAVLSIASDLRYHLWSMIAAALAAVLLANGEVPGERRLLVAGGVLLMGVIVAGLVARVILPAAPASYAGMLAW